MKNRIVLLLFFLGLAAITACNSKRDTWTDDQKNAWLDRCKAATADSTMRESTRKNLDAFCDCMFEVTARSYTPDGVNSIPPEEQRKLVQDCAYAW